MAEEVVSGGGVNYVTREGETVYRTRSDYSAAVERVLELLAAHGFAEVPRFLGIAADGRQMLSFQPGTAGIDPLSPDLVSDQAVISSAQLLRRFHDATEQLVRSCGLRGPWMLPPREPAEVLCHGDFAPYNVVFQGQTATAIIDLDTVHPSPRVRDIAYALYRFAPLMAEANPLSHGSLALKGARARLFCDAYRLPDDARPGLIAGAVARLLELVAFMRAEAGAVSAAFQRHLDEGHAEGYLADVDYLRANESQFERALRWDGDWP